MLPYLPGRTNKTKSQIINFGGLNLTQTAKEGELRSSKNLSSDEYPYLVTRKARSVHALLSSPHDLFAWGGLLVVDGTDLIYNNAVVGTVLPGEKQFAVINTKLCVFPDKKYLDLTNNEFKSLDASITSAENSVEFGADYIEIDPVPATIPGSAQLSYIDGSVPLVKTYMSVSWDSVTGWTKTGYAELPITGVTVGSIIIPAKVSATGALIIPTKTGDGDYTGDENDEGYYFEITSVNHSGDTAHRWEKFDVTVTQSFVYALETWSWVRSDYAPYGASGYSSYTFNPSTGEMSVAGEYLSSVNGVAYIQPSPGVVHMISVGNQVVSTHTAVISGPTRVTSYSKGGTSYGYVYATDDDEYPVNDKKDGFWYVYLGATGYDGVMTLGYNARQDVENEPLSEHFRDGDVVDISGCTTYAANNLSNLVVKSVDEGKITFESVPEGSFDIGAEAGAVTVKREVPDFSFICESNNRLCGVKDQIIYASALGDPMNYHKFEGLSTDSYNVAVGSDGAFTGCIAYSDNVVFFKENLIYILYGSFPDEYTLKSYSWPGLQAGSHKSTQIINEILYYMGKLGIYAYSGGTPSLISYDLGTSGYYDAVCGSDGLKYYVSTRTADNTWKLFVYDTLRKLWLKEDDTRVRAFAYYDEALYFIDNERVYRVDGASSLSVEWQAELVEFTETVLDKKVYSRLILRTEIDEGSVLRVEISHDGDEYAEVYSTGVESNRTPVIYISPMRCDSFSIRLSGTGRCVIKSVQREFKTRSNVR